MSQYYLNIIRFWIFKTIDMGILSNKCTKKRPAIRYITRPNLKNQKITNRKALTKNLLCTILFIGL